ncbi:MAG: hypothetical protein ABGY75_01875 [Gemmataceae bacterium]
MPEFLDETDDEPDEWRTALPIRSPWPLVIALAVVQAVVAALLVLYAVVRPAGFTPPTGWRY